MLEPGIFYLVFQGMLLTKGFTLNVSPSTFSITALSPFSKGTSLTALHSSPLMETCPSVPSHRFISTTSPSIPFTPDSDFFFRFLIEQNKGITKCSITSKTINPIIRVIITLFIMNFSPFTISVRVDRSTNRNSASNNKDPVYFLASCFKSMFF